MNKELGCVEMVYVEESDLRTTPHQHGILYTNSDDTNWSWCRSALGVAPGFTNNNGSIEHFGANKDW